MNKSICLFLTLILMLGPVYSFDLPVVNFNFQTYWINFYTLTYVQTGMFWCLWTSLFALFFNDHGVYFNQCFDTFVTKAQFY